MVEQRNHNPLVEGSNPSLATTHDKEQIEDIYDVMRKILRQFVPQCSVNEMEHQLEYLDFKVDKDGAIFRTGENVSQNPITLNCFARLGKDEEIVDELQKVLEIYYEQFKEYWKEKVLRGSLLFM